MGTVAGQHKLPTYVIGPLRIDTHRKVASTEHGMVRLTGAEWALVEMLAHSAPATMDRDAICRTVLRRGLEGPFDRRADQLVFALRRKLPPDEMGAPLIRSQRGIGYYMRSPDRVED